MGKKLLPAPREAQGGASRVKRKTLAKNIQIAAAWPGYCRNPRRYAWPGSTSLTLAHHLAGLELDAASLLVPAGVDRGAREDALLLSALAEREDSEVDGRLMAEREESECAPSLLGCVRADFEESEVDGRLVAEREESECVSSLRADLDDAERRGSPAAEESAE